MASSMIFTSESVTPGHPDKLCDQISDAAIDAFLREDAGARAVVECAVATGIVFLAARFAAEAVVDLPSIARKVIASAGYFDPQFDARNCSILTSLVELPKTTREPPPKQFDEEAIEKGVAQDQANVFGYACRDTPELMPLPVSLAHRLARNLDHARRTGAPGLSPDGKTQVSIEYADGRPARIHSISITAAVAADGAGAELADRLRAMALETFGDDGLKPDARTKIHINAGGFYETGGPARHAGLTGRKNGIDTYGEIARQSGAALSGKDPSRIDRIGAYAARHAAKNVVAAGLADRCEVHVAYAIGRADPLSLSVETFGSGRLDDAEIAARLTRSLDLRPLAITARFGLRTRPAHAGDAGFYSPLAVYGHFGRADLDLPWEALDLVEALRG
ncbi:methionine adenosyltransferase [Methylocapsa aurea]|uniref:methionine adenosyltransferase n=1 Tax=Methylocapsa aurea TaxID=663610 RepID=UPI00056714B5|nr:methionine adenosyltransferase [Methylocapsa aurea]